MNDYIIHYGAWVTDDGSWSQDTVVLTFHPDQLTAEQWQRLDELPDSQKLLYVEAVLNNADLSEWEE